MAPAYRIRAWNDLLLTSWCQSRDHITPSGTWRHFATSAVEGDSRGITKYCVLDIFFWSKTSLDELKCNILLVSGSQQASDLSFLFVSHFIFFSVCGYLLLCGFFFLLLQLWAWHPDSLSITWPRLQPITLSGHSSVHQLQPSHRSLSGCCFQPAGQNRSAASI